MGKILSTTITKFVEVINGFLKKVLCRNGDIASGEDSLKYWKNRIFCIVSVVFIVLGAPLFLYGAYMYFIRDYKVYSVIEILLYIVITTVITRKSLSLRGRKTFIVLILYSMSFFLLISTGMAGAGMICIVFSLILSGCLLERRQIVQVLAVNIAAFAVLTVLLMNGNFDGTLMGEYKSVWVINVITAQGAGVGLLFIMNSIYMGLENQAKLIKDSRELLAASEAKNSAMIANISDVIIIADEKGIITYNSPNLERRFGWTAEDISKKPFYEKIFAEDRNRFLEELQSLQGRHGLEKTIEARYLCRDGSIKYIELTAVNLMEDSNIGGILVNYRDITERNLREEKIRHLSFHDNLTGLYNRTFFENEKERLDNESMLPLSVIVGDINGLKIINDSLGHDEGDKLLVAIAQILEGCCRKDDISARIGGDEFAVLMPKTSIETVSEIVRKINSACEEYNKKVAGELYRTSMSLGYSSKTNMEESLDSVLRVAEDYMYKHKLLEVRSLHSSIISSMKTALSEKSQETEEHAQRLVKLTKAVGQAVGLTNQQFDELELFSALHDIGKIGIDDQILNKPDKLSPTEWVEMKKHSEIGCRIAMASQELMSVAYYILTHHERWDGSGYPQGLSGKSIPLLSRILAVADAYDAMTEDRPYRKGMSKEKAIEEIVRNSGTQFDPEMAEIFVDIVSKEESLPEHKDIEQESFVKMNI
ncbi:MAG: diguanylate cyclase [Bacillota bacterium]|nr:diguanylate cyclase [Bacillota bacterium]